MNAELMQVIAKRQRLIRVWPKFAAALAALTIGFYVWAFISQPILVNPLHVINLLQNNALSGSTEALLSVMTPILFLAIGVLLLLLLVFVTAGLINEGRLMRLLEQHKTG